MSNAFILCDLVWKVQKSHVANTEGSFKGKAECFFDKIVDPYMVPIDWTYKYMIEYIYMAPRHVDF